MARPNSTVLNDNLNGESGTLQTQRGLMARVASAIHRAFKDDLAGPHRAELQEAQRDTILNRTLVLIGISIFVMPSTILLYVYSAAPEKLGVAGFIVGIAVGCALVLAALIKLGLFDKYYSLAFFTLVAGVFGPTGTAVSELTRHSQRDFFFAFFLIFFAFASLFPASIRWIIATSAGIGASYVGGRLFRPEGIVWNTELIESVLYLFELSFIGAVLNRVIVKLFMAERTAQFELRQTRDALADEMEVAQHIQRLLLPKEPELPGYQLHGLMVTATELGGDYYDVIVTESGRQFIAIGDVSGHGVTTGLTMMMVRSSLLGTLEAAPDATLHLLYNSTNRCLRQNLARMDIDMYMTFVLFEHMGQGQFRGVGAHPPPLVYRQGTGAVEEIPMQGVWLGVVDDIEKSFCPEVTLKLSPGDMLLMYTDGIVECENADSEMFGFERLSNALRTLAEEDVQQVTEGLIEVMETHSQVRDDDVTLLAVRYVGGDDKVKSGGSNHSSQPTTTSLAAATSTPAVDSR